MSAIISSNAYISRRFAILCALLMAMIVSGDVFAQDNVPPTNIAATLVADGAAVPGKELTLAFRFVPRSDEWHGYWSNPGDAGFGMQLDWNLPEGWSVGEARYPVPKRLVIGELMNHIYEGEYAVLVPVSVPANARVGSMARIAVDAVWLACTDEICVPEQARLTATVPIAASASDAPMNAQFAVWRAAIAPILDSAARFATSGDRLRIAIPLPAAVILDDPHIFVANTGLVAYDLPQTFRRDGDVLVAEIVLQDSGLTADDIEGILSFGGSEGVAFEAGPGNVPSGGDVVGSASAELPSLWVLLSGALAGGLLLNIMPCVFPILSLKALSLARAGIDQATARRDGFAYTAGVVLSCVALGGLLLVLRAGGQQIGWAFQLQEPGFVVALLIIAALITANFAGLFELPSLPITRSGQTAGAFATGVLAAFAATPCTGPFMAAALGAALLLPPVQALLLFTMLGLGLALPFLLIGLVPALRHLLPKPGKWMATFRRLMAIPMGLTALALVWLVWRLGGASYALASVCVAAVLVALFVTVGRRQARGANVFLPIVAGTILVAFVGTILLPRFIDESPSVLDGGIISAGPFSENALSQARATGHPVFVWFTADWCVTCKVNENIAIEREATHAAFERAGVIALRADWTRRDPAITRFLTQQGVAGVPLYLWYPAGGEAQTLPQVLTPDSLITLADRSVPVSRSAARSAASGDTS